MSWRHFPQVTLALEKTLIIEGEHQELVMSGAGSSWQDLALHLVARQLGSAVAQAMAKFFAFDLHTDGMAAYSVFSPRFDHGDAAVERAQRWIADHLDCHLAVERMAAGSGAAERSSRPIDEIAWAAGYEDPAFFRADPVHIGHPGGARDGNHRAGQGRARAGRAGRGLRSRIQASGAMQLS